MRRPRVVFVSADPMTPDRLQRGQLAWLRERGFDVVVIASPGLDLARVRKREGVTVVPLPIPRAVAPGADLVALARLARHLRRLRPDLVVAGTPKGGLLGTLAARLAGVPVVVYHLRGLRLDTAKGRMRLILRLTEVIASRSADRVQCNGDSLKAGWVALRMGPPEKCFIPASGSSNGVMAARFAHDAGFRLDERERLGIPRDAPVVGFVGRLTKDKGIVELLAAFEQVSRKFATARLVIVGDWDETDPVPESTRVLTRDPRVKITGMLADPALMYSVFDLLAFPSHREGFPNVPLEAAAAGLPVVGARVTGTVDALVDGVTGTLHEPGDADGLAAAIVAYLRDPALRIAHGSAGRRRVVKEFRPEVVWQALGDEYARLLAEKGLPQPDPSSPARSVPSSTRLRAKRAVDATIAGLGLVAAAPVMAGVAAVVRADMGSPVVFRQERAGEGGRPFHVYKFRSMKDATGPDGTPLPDDQRLTRLGRLLRATSLDELPQLWNVLKGDMSLVGPRPLYLKYLDRYTDEERRRLDVRPGITGWAQVNGRNAVDWTKRLAMDVWYVDHWSLRLDARILARTVGKVLRSDGISSDGQATMQELQPADRR